VKKVVDAAQGLRERKKARTREAIIDAALDLFGSKGFEATTIEDIAAAAEVSPRTFFRYFDSKPDLIMARSGGKEHEIGPRLAARPRGEALLDAVRAVVRAELDDHLADPLLVRELQVMLTTPSLRKLAREHFLEEEADMVGAVADRLGVGHDDLVAQVTAGAIASAIWVTVNRWVADGADRERLQPMLDEAFAVLADGLPSSAAGAPSGPQAR
jgi:AcrR family transcriptional regulator